MFGLRHNYFAMSKPGMMFCCHTQLKISSENWLAQQWAFDNKKMCLSSSASTWRTAALSLVREHKAKLKTNAVHTIGEQELVSDKSLAHCLRKLDRELTS